MSIWGCMEKIGCNVRNVLESLNSKRGARPMSSRRTWVWTGRVAALVAAVVIPACGNTGSPGGANPNGILWNSQATPGGGAPGAATPGWIDPNLGVVGPIGIQNIIVSTDDATYDGFFPNGQGLSGIGPAQASQIQYIAG